TWRWSCAFFQTAGKSLSVLTTVHPNKNRALLPIGVNLVYRIWRYKSMTVLQGFFIQSVLPKKAHQNYPNADAEAIST
ncbi:MAG: hypothetical protein J0653_07015, partial [Deltaproteobacteria bacterium]|nr:hypothetical protein [Deltaproteobacteria bacterium]